MQAITDWSKNLRVEVRGDDVAQHAGCVLPRMLADATGLTEGLSAAVSRPEVTHDRGGVLRDVAVSICDGGRDISDVVVLGQQPRLFEPVASIPTVWRSLNELDASDIAAITVVRNRIRPKVWEAIAARHGAIPPAPTCDGDLGCHHRDPHRRVADRLAQRQTARGGQLQGRLGVSSADGLVRQHRRAAGDHPPAGQRRLQHRRRPHRDHRRRDCRGPRKWRHNLLVTIDGAGSSHAVVEHLTKLNARPGWSVHYSVGFDLDERVRVAIGQLPASTWEPALDPHGKARQDAQVAELTGLLRESVGGDRLDGWPADMRILVRREKIDEGTQLSLFEQSNGYRYQVLATATRGGQVQRLEARHRVHARVEGFIRNAKDTGLGRWLSSSFAINTAWITTAALAIDLLCWMRLLLLDGPLAKAEPATLRHRLLHTAVRLISHSRHLILRVCQTWPWAQEFADAFNRALAIP